MVKYWLSERQQVDLHNLQVGEPETEIDQLYSQLGQKGEIE